MTGASTVAALLTPLAPGAIAVVGLAGPRADEILGMILRAAKSDHPPAVPVDRPVFCRLVDGDENIEDVIVARRIHDGQTIAEINSHGGVRIAQRILALLARRGAAIIDGLEFHEMLSTCKAIERDVDRALLRSASRRMTRWLLRQRKVLPGYMAGIHRQSSEEVSGFRRRSEAAIRLLDGLRIALIGPPNSGKSTLANRLIGTDRLITSAQPGTTRDWVSETALIQGWPVMLTDTAGVRATNCVIEAEAIRRGGLQARSADAAVVVLDATADPQELRLGLDAALDLMSPGQVALVVINKVDLGAASMSSTSGLGGCEALFVSALTGEGIPILEARLASSLGLDLLDVGLPTAILPEHLPSNPP
jgi:tRNA modification GTPase